MTFSYFYYTTSSCLGFHATNHEYGGYGDEPRRKREDNNKPNHVLLFTIINPVYPITVPTKLNVYKNDAESWDYTTPALVSLVKDAFKSRCRQLTLEESEA
ncbi:hypothetical protein PV326_008547 [Microctonus aethiopoides]|nr:hypothetical protein PV326_008547 [Microctonus aethiopoides]